MSTLWGVCPPCLYTIFYLVKRIYFNFGVVVVVVLYHLIKAVERISI